MHRLQVLTGCLMSFKIIWPLSPTDQNNHTAIGDSRLMCHQMLTATTIKTAK